MTSVGALMAYAVVGMAHLVAIGVDADAVQWVTKALLMPLLALYAALAARSRGETPSRLLLWALGWAWLGDIVLEYGGTAPLIAGMVCFFIGYGGYAVAFVRAGALSRLRLTVLCGYAAFVIAMLVWLWPGLSDQGLAIPMAFYAAMMAFLASTAATLGARIGAGGALLLLSDALIGVRLAEAADIPGQPYWVMLTYMLGQALVVTGWPHVRRGMR
ncbi:lysoplasmalogenase [Phytohabitans rumicis]|uniref:Lysoplasmalogenase n=1 Tax=Phytohabitans rumicis TaxID=1076125 RepID=A0A6V8L628_9ACTN|nr:lysoplasmalogenase [Phytohabitans rumicis]GFJ92692.1 hypothetical protein Prum_063340 [Phytohabitans rumicis]